MHHKLASKAATAPLPCATTKPSLVNGFHCTALLLPQWTDRKVLQFTPASAKINSPGSRGTICAPPERGLPVKGTISWRVGAVFWLGERRELTFAFVPTHRAVQGRK